MNLNFGIQAIDVAGWWLKEGGKIWRRGWDLNPVWSKNSSNLVVSEKFKYFNAGKLIEGTPEILRGSSLLMAPLRFLAVLNVTVCHEPQSATIEQNEEFLLAILEQLDKGNLDLVWSKNSSGLW
jgi:hypothetical protein